jgi:hypothetical protein
MPQPSLPQRIIYATEASAVKRQIRFVQTQRTIAINTHLYPNVTWKLRR